MTSRFFRFLSKRGPKSSAQDLSSKGQTASNNFTNAYATATSKCQSSVLDNESSNSTNKHVKLNGCEDLKESIEHYNQRCAAIKQLKEKEEELSKLRPAQPTTTSAPSNSFSPFKSFNKKFKTNKKQALVDQQQQRPTPPKDSIECAVFFLDNTQEHFFLPKKALAAKLYEQVFYHLDLIETDYFGLQFSDTHNVKHWLDPSKPIKKQSKIGPPYQFFFKVNILFYEEA